MVLSTGTSTGFDEIEERLRQYAEVVVEVGRRFDRELNERSLTRAESGGTVSAGSEVEPQHLKTPYDQ
jgi:hypothetical protein